jgi:cytochrome c553
MFIRYLSATMAAGLLIVAAAVPLQAQDAMEATAQTCNACHSQNGVPPDPKTTPIIWGQQVSYLFKQMSDYRNGAREHPIMAPMAKNVDRGDLRPLAVYIAGKTWPAKAAGVTPAAAPADEKIAICKACHQQNFEGGLPAPRLAGLSYEYLKAQMDAFANDTRTNNQDMPPLMKALSQSDRDQIARYLSAL